MLWLLATPLCKLSSKAFLIPSLISGNMGQQTITLKKDNNEFSFSICFFPPFLRNSNVLWKQGSTISSTPTFSWKMSPLTELTLLVKQIIAIKLCSHSCNLTTLPCRQLWLLKRKARAECDSGLCFQRTDQLHSPQWRASAEGEKLNPVYQNALDVAA